MQRCVWCASLAVANVRWQLYRMKYERRSCCSEFQTLACVDTWNNERRTVLVSKHTERIDKSEQFGKLVADRTGPKKPFAKVQLQHMAQRVNYIAVKFFKLHMHSHFESTYSYLSNASLLFTQRKQNSEQEQGKKPYNQSQIADEWESSAFAFDVLKRPSFYFEMSKHS